MRIASFRIHNYKSFSSTEEIQLKPGFNVIVGQNNVGKTALMEALSLRFSDKHHRSLKTVPTALVSPNPISQTEVSFSFSRNELMQLLSALGTFYVPVLNNAPLDMLMQRFANAILDENTLETVFASGGFRTAYLSAYDNPPDSSSMLATRVLYTGGQFQFQTDGLGSAAPTNTYGYSLANLIWHRIYRFSAERLNVGEYAVGADSNLAADARNLAQVLNLLQSSNVSRFRRLNEYVTTIFPQIKQITVPPAPGTPQTVRISVWAIDPESEREDLAVPLAESGTGIGQILAMLYVVLTSVHPRIILIDEPQSFLHPGAVRKLFDILKEHSQHQYIVTTHSPTVVTSADPQTLLLLRKVEVESVVEPLDVHETQQLRLFLSEIGARLSDVFGADNILWVEGPTEEQCFPLILASVAKQPLLGTAIIGVMQTGDFEGRHSQTILDIYRRLSEGRGLLPPATGFIFDKEGRSERERTDLIRQSRGAVFFTPRRMYENYLLNPHAIASVASSIGGFRESPIAVAEIEEWFERHRWDRQYFGREIGEADRTDELWSENVHGARILKSLFSHFSEGRVNYDKVAHGVALTTWIIEHAPDDLKELAELIQRVLARRQDLSGHTQ